MARRSAAKRAGLPKSAFACPERRILPIQDGAHVRASLARFAQTTFASMAEARAAAKRILRAAKRHQVQVNPAGAVARMALQAARRSNPAGLSAADRKALGAARRVAREFHGTSAEVVELSAQERRPLPRFVAVAGELTEFTYAPDPASKRGSYQWSHLTGDRGAGKPRARKRPLAVVDPATRRLAVVADKSPMRFNSKKGFIG